VNNTNPTGLFGKLPAHGDFIYRDLPAQFMTVFDSWLQGFVGGSQEQLGEQWLETYLTSPIWRFAFSEGVIDENGWAGLFLPSVDRVGRYFPFSIATRLPGSIAPTEFISTQMQWYDAMEDIALRALDGELQIEDIVEEINQPDLLIDSSYVRGSCVDNTSALVMNMEFEEQSPSTVIPYMLDACLTHLLASYSAWSTKGSQLVEPCLFTSKGLPPIGGIAAMLDGRWEEWRWQQPFYLNAGGLSVGENEFNPQLAERRLEPEQVPEQVSEPETEHVLASDQAEEPQLDSKIQTIIPEDDELFGSSE